MKEITMTSKTLCITILIFLSANTLYAQELFYPEAAVEDLREKEVQEIKKTQDLQRNINQTNHQLEQKKVEAEIEITRQKIRIQDQLAKQDSIQNELKSLRLNLDQLENHQKEMEKDLGRINDQVSKQNSELLSSEFELSTKKQNLVKSLANLKLIEQKTQSEIARIEIDAAKARTAISRTETDMARMKNDMARTQALEIRAKTEYSQVQERLANAVAQRDQIDRASTEAQSQLSKARRELNFAQREFQDAEKERLQAEIRYKTEKISIFNELKYIETSIANASNRKTQADADKVRMEAELAKLRLDLIAVKEKSQEVYQQDSLIHGEVMESRISLEQAKTDLMTELSRSETAALDRDTSRVLKKFKLSNKKALIEKPSDENIMSAGIPIQLPAKRAISSVSTGPWVTSRVCYSRPSPSSSSENIALIKRNTTLNAEESTDGYIKFSDETGKSLYINAKCGSFQN